MMFEEILYEALASPFGVEVETNSPENLRAKLYAARRSNSDFECLSITISPYAPTSALFIVKKGQPNATEETHS
jgi:hypothetical protein